MYAVVMRDKQTGDITEMRGRHFLRSRAVAVAAGINALRSRHAPELAVVLSPMELASMREFGTPDGQ